ncbi:hypothetical protein PVK06_042838 [Gossypium arboreum]|uniref:Uncharacterized protein n=1 Tax=Gossypium arboreum TaxID=29729 RepID=A0ABR0MLV6_GOSAR|nr:hypothetical protein PVK06_042838 [Gossypium arboreum]
MESFFQIIDPTYMELTLEFCTTFHLQHVMSTHDEAGTITFRLGLSPPPPSYSLLALLLFDRSYCELDSLRCEALQSDFSPSSTTIYLCHLGSHLDWEAREYRVVSTTDAYLLWSMATGHVFDFAYFITLAFRHQTDHHREGPICLGPYVTRLAYYFDLFNTPEMSSTLTLVGQMSP